MLPELMPIRTFSGRPPSSVGPEARSECWQASAARQASTAWSAFVTGAPQNAMTASPMNLSIVPPWLNIEILGEQRNDLIAKPFGQSSKAGNVREHHRQSSHRAPRPPLDALAQQRPHEIRLHIFSKSRQTAAHTVYAVA